MPGTDYQTKKTKTSEELLVLVKAENTQGTHIYGGGSIYGELAKDGTMIVNQSVHEKKGEPDTTVILGIYNANEWCSCRIPTN